MPSINISPVEDSNSYLSILSAELCGVAYAYDTVYCQVPRTFTEKPEKSIVCTTSKIEMYHMGLQVTNHANPVAKASVYPDLCLRIFDPCSYLEQITRSLPFLFLLFFLSPTDC